MKASGAIALNQPVKTKQVTEYQAGDDGTYEAGWWKGRLNVNNKTRFVIKTIGSDVVIIDRATGLMWAADGDAAGCNNGGLLSWSDAIDYANGLSFAGFTDWRLPNVIELFTISDFALSDPSIDETFFLNTASLKYWSSTTYADNTLMAWRIDFRISQAYRDLKTETFDLRCVRGGL